MAKINGLFQRLNPFESKTIDATAATASTNSRYEKDAITRDGSPALGQKSGNDVEPDADAIVQPGELSFEEDTSGGLGRHLGLFSTTFLM